MSILHCVSTITRIISEDRRDPRSLLQLGYNLGRLSELTGLGREPFWDRWKDPVAAWDRQVLTDLARDLLTLSSTLTNHANIGNITPVRSKESPDEPSCPPESTQTAFSG